MGVELRVHTFFLLLAVVCLGLSASDGIMRGLGLFMVLVIALLTRETARLMVAAWLGLRLRAILLLPIGGLFAYANPESQENGESGSRAICHRVCGAPGQRGNGAGAGGDFSGRGGSLESPHPAADLARRICCAAWSGCRPAWCCTCCPLIRWIADG